MDLNFKVDAPRSHCARAIILVEKKLFLTVWILAHSETFVAAGDICGYNVYDNSVPKQRKINIGTNKIQHEVELNTTSYRKSIWFAER